MVAETLPLEFKRRQTVTTVAVMAGVFAALTLGGVPVVVGLTLGAMIGVIITTDLPLLIVVQRMVVSLDSFVLIAIPLFILAGVLMNAGGIIQRLFRLSDALVGHLVGGLGQVNVLLSLFMGGLSGSSTADAAMDSKLTWPIMVKSGYSPDFAAAVTACSAIIAPIIPPSIAMIIYASITGTSVGRLFVAGIIPGSLLALAMGIVVHVVSTRHGYGAHRTRASAGEVRTAVKNAGWGLALPVLIIGGIRVGIFTPTEAAGAAAIYAFLVGTLVYRELTWSKVPVVLLETAVVTGVILLIIAAAAPFAWILTQARVPQLLTEWITGITAEPALFLLVVNVLLLGLGCLMEVTSLILVMSPLLAPVAAALGIDPVHFGIVLILNLVIGNVTPPFGQLVFVVSAVTKVPAERIFRQSLLFYVALVIVLLQVTYLPQSYMWLVEAIGP